MAVDPINKSVAVVDTAGDEVLNNCALEADGDFDNDASVLEMICESRMGYPNRHLDLTMDWNTF